MDANIQQALKTDRVIDITTIGRKSGQPRRIEIWFHNLDGTLYITGRPGKRSWYANMVAHPKFTFHLKESAQADIPATARAITGAEERHTIFTKLLENIDFETDFDDWMANSPLVEVTLDTEA